MCTGEYDPSNSDPRELVTSDAQGLSQVERAVFTDRQDLSEARAALTWDSTELAHDTPKFHVRDPLCHCAHWACRIGDGFVG